MAPTNPPPDTTATAATTTPRPRGAARREALLEATLRVLAEVGADAVTHRRVAAEAQLPLASTTYHFASKDELLTEALRHASQRDIARLQEATRTVANLAQAAGARPTAAQITDVLICPVDAGRSSLLATYTLLLEAARRPALQELARRWTDAYVSSLASLLQAAGSRTPADDARLLIAAGDGLIVDQLAGGWAADPRPELERLTALLLNRGPSAKEPAR